MLSSVANHPSLYVLDVLNGTVQVSAGRGGLGILVQRAGHEHGLLLSIEDAAQLAAALVLAANSPGAREPLSGPFTPTA